MKDTTVNKKISILISTKNRVNELLYTLNEIQFLIERDDVDCVVFDDGSTDNTSQTIKQEFPKIQLLRNETSKGYLFCRNKMLNETNAKFAISLDDDAHFITANPIEIIESYFNHNSSCGVIATRIFWGINAPKQTSTELQNLKVKSFVGCGHVWNMNAWRDIPNYPEWYQFYGEENFASLQLFKQKWEVHYLTDIFVQHRVDLIKRTQKNKDFAIRYRRALRADWCNYFLFLPFSKIPIKMGYSIWMQFKNKIFKGDLKIVKPLILAIFDLLLLVPKFYKHRNALTINEYNKYCKLKDAKVFWKPEK